MSSNIRRTNLNPLSLQPRHAEQPSNLSRSERKCCSCCFPLIDFLKRKFTSSTNINNPPDTPALQSPVDLVVSSTPPNLFVKAPSKVIAGEANFDTSSTSKIPIGAPVLAGTLLAPISQIPSPDASSSANSSPEMPQPLALLNAINGSREELGAIFGPGNGDVDLSTAARNHTNSQGTIPSSPSCMDFSILIRTPSSLPFAITPLAVAVDLRTTPSELNGEFLRPTSPIDKTSFLVINPENPVLAANNSSASCVSTNPKAIYVGDNQELCCDFQELGFNSLEQKNILEQIKIHDSSAVVFVIDLFAAKKLDIAYFQEIVSEGALTSMKFVSKKPDDLPDDFHAEKVILLNYTEIKAPSVLFLTLGKELVQGSILKVLLGFSPNLRDITLEDAKAPRLPECKNETVAEINLTNISEITSEFIGQLSNIFSELQAITLRDCRLKDSDEKITDTEVFKGQLTEKQMNLLRIA